MHAITEPARGGGRPKLEVYVNLSGTAAKPPLLFTLDVIHQECIIDQECNSRGCNVCEQKHQQTISQMYLLASATARKDVAAQCVRVLCSRPIGLRQRLSTLLKRCGTWQKGALNLPELTTLPPGACFLQHAAQDLEAHSARFGWDCEVRMQ